MSIWGRYLGQGITYLMFIAFIGYFSSNPVYTNVPEDQALIKLTFTHASKRVKPVHDMRSKEDMAKLPPQLRAKKRSRERFPLRVEFEMDGKIVYKAEILPRGLSRDLPSPVYQRFTVPAGKHHFLIRMGDDNPDKGFSYFGEKTVNLAPLHTMIIDFDNIRNKFIFE
jgi:hypothetical protein